MASENMTTSPKDASNPSPMAAQASGKELSPPPAPPAPPVPAVVMPPVAPVPAVHHNPAVHHPLLFVNPHQVPAQQVPPQVRPVLVPLVPPVIPPVHPNAVERRVLTIPPSRVEAVEKELEQKAQTQEERQSLKCGHRSCRCPPKDTPKFKCYYYDDCKKLLHVECYRACVLEKNGVEHFDPENNMELVACGKRHYDRAKHMCSKLVSADSHRNISWNRDGAGGPSDPKTSEGVLMEHLLSGHNFARFQQLEKRTKVCHEISKKIAAANCKKERHPKAVRSKIMNLLALYGKAEEWSLSREGQRVLQRQGKEAFDAAIKKICSFYFRFLPAVTEYRTNPPTLASSESDESSVSSKGSTDGSDDDDDEQDSNDDASVNNNGNDNNNKTRSPAKKPGRSTIVNTSRAASKRSATTDHEKDKPHTKKRRYNESLTASTAATTNTSSESSWELVLAQAKASEQALARSRWNAEQKDRNFNNRLKVMREYKEMKKLGYEDAVLKKILPEMGNLIDALNAKDDDDTEDDYGKSTYKAKATRAGNTSIIELNVGGTIFSTSRATLLSFHSKYFAKLFGQQDDDDEDDDESVVQVTTTKDEFGRFFIDRDAELFSHVLGFMRGSFTAEDAQAMTEHQRRSLKREAIFYQLESLCHLLEGKPTNNDGAEDNSSVESQDKPTNTDNGAIADDKWEENPEDKPKNDDHDEAVTDNESEKCQEKPKNDDNGAAAGNKLDENQENKPKNDDNDEVMADNDSVASPDKPDIGAANDSAVSPERPKGNNAKSNDGAAVGDLDESPDKTKNSSDGAAADKSEMSPDKPQDDDDGPVADDSEASQAKPKSEDDAAVADDSKTGEDKPKIDDDAAAAAADDS